MNYDKKLQEIAEKRKQIQTNLQQYTQAIKICESELYYLQGKEELINEIQEYEKTTKKITKKANV